MTTEDDDNPYVRSAREAHRLVFGTGTARQERRRRAQVYHLTDQDIIDIARAVIKADRQMWPRR